MEFDNTRGLSFLLSLAAVPLTACPAPSDGTTGAGTDATTGNASTSGATAEQTSATTATNAGDSSSETGGTASDTTEPTETTGTSGTTGDPASICPDFQQRVFECVPYSEYSKRDYYLTYCTDKIAMYTAYSQECGAAAEELFACLGTAPCSDLQSMSSCPEENEALDVACGTGGTEGG